MSPRRAATLTLIALGLGLSATPAIGQSLNDTSVTRQPLIVPRTNAPKPHDRPDFDALGTRVRAAVDAGVLSQSLSRPLSDACAAGRFNQAKRGRYYLTMDMPSGRKKRFGYAGSNGMNLKDPKDQAATDEGYLFDLDGSSECRVYTFPIR